MDSVDSNSGLAKPIKICVSVCVTVNEARDGPVIGAELHISPDSQDVPPWNFWTFRLLFDIVKLFNEFCGVPTQVIELSFP